MKDKSSSSSRCVTGCLSLVALCSLYTVATADTVYKWADERGVIHYSDHRVPGKTVQEIEVQAGPCLEEIERAKQEAERDKREAERLQTEREHPPRASLGSALGPLPPNSTSEYLTTLGTGFWYHFEEGQLLSQYWINVQAVPDLPIGAYLEFHFEDPVHYDQQVVVGKTVEVNDKGVKEDYFAMQSPALKGIQCRNYEILVEVYSNKAKSVLLGRHRQIDQSRVDSSLVSSPADLVGRLGTRGHCCPQ